MCYIPKAVEFCICCENNESRNTASEYRKLISLIGPILNVASCHTVCFICKIRTDKFCCLRNCSFFHPDKDICVPRSGQAHNWARALEGNRQQNPRFQFISSEPATSCLPSFGSLAFELLASWEPGCKTRAEPDLQCHGWAAFSSDVQCGWEPKQDSHFPGNGQQTSLSSQGNLATWTQAQGTGGHLHLTEMS